MNGEANSWATSPCPNLRILARVVEIKTKGAGRRGRRRKRTSGDQVSETPVDGKRGEQ